MSELIKYREQQNLTQEELAEKSGLSVRTIQRIEAGTPPKGYTLKALARALGIEAKDLIKKDAYKMDTYESGNEINVQELNKAANGKENSEVRLLKFINLSSIPFTLLPPLNIIVPLLIIFYKKEKHPLTKQILSVQILWTILAVIIFMLAVFIRKWFGLDNRFITLILFGLILSNILIILKNAKEIDRNGTLSVKLNFNLL